MSFREAESGFVEHKKLDEQTAVPALLNHSCVGSPVFSWVKQKAVLSVSTDITQLNEAVLVNMPCKSQMMPHV